MSEEMSENNVPIVLVDGTSYIYRAFHALPALTNSQGRNTGAVKGVVNMLRRLQKDYPESPVAAVFDAKGKTFRNDMYDKYKANRPPMPDELREQIEPIYEIVQAMGLPFLCVDGVEADDVIGTLAREAAGEGRLVIMSTGDKDMAQLVDDRVTMVNTMTGTVMDPAGVEEKLGVPPQRVIDLLALMGDKVDNIPGVPGVGEKTALALLQNLGGLEDIYAQPEKVADLEVRGAKTLAAKLEAEQDSARLSYKLATIKTDVALDVRAVELANGEPDRERLLKWFRDLEFKGWTEELLTGEDAVPDQGMDDGDYEIITAEADLDAWLKELKAASAFAFDTETTTLDYMKAQVVGLSFAVEPGRAAYVPMAHDYAGAPQQLDRKKVLQKLKPLLEDPARSKIGQNLKYDASVLVNHDIHLRGISHDTMLESYVLDSTATPRHDMHSLALKYLGRPTTQFSDIAGKGKNQLTFNQIPLEQAGPYAAEDADITLRLHQELWSRLQAESGLCSVFEDIEMPLVPVLMDMERKGALLDRDMLRTQSGELGERLLELEQRAYDLAGGQFNLGSPKQLGEILFEQLELPVIKKTPKGAPSTAEDVLVELALDYPLPAVILEHRGLSKLKSTYTDKLPEMVNPDTGRVHTSYHQAVAATGRLSSSDPNLQNIPIRTEEGRRIRQAFVAPRGCRIVAADYSQIELRIMAHLSSDEGLLHAFREGLDVHRATAAEVFGVPLEKVSAEQRRKAKAINFGLIYGMSAFGLGKQLHLGRHEAQDYINRYFERYPGVQAYMDDTRKLAHEQGFVQTLFGRRLYLPEINASNKMRQQAAERTAINAPMQGSAADIIKRAMLRVDGWLRENGLKARMIMQVHDELVLEVPTKELDTVTAGICEQMAAAAELSVPLSVDAGVGNNWDEAH